MKPELPDCPDIWWWLFFFSSASYEIKRLERTIIWIPCKNRGENGALFQKIFLLSSSSDTMERQNLMLSPSKFLFKKEKSQNWFACFELFKLAALLLLQNIIWILVQVLPRALSTKTKPLRDCKERDLNQQSFACQFNILMILEYSTSGKFTFMTWQKVKTKKEESLQARWCYSRNRMRSQRVSSGKGIFSVFSACCLG